MAKYQLTSDLGYFYVFTAHIMGIGMLGFLAYSIFSLNLIASLLCLLLVLLYYFRFYRDVRRFKNVSFDEAFVYCDETRIPMQQIIKIDNKKIIYREQGHELYLYYNYFLPKNKNQLVTLYTSYSKVPEA